MYITAFMGKLNEISSNAWVNGAMKVLFELIIAVIIWFVGKKLIRIAVSLLEKLLTKRNIEMSVRKFLLMAVKYLLYGVLVFAIVEYVSGTTASLMALLGSFGVTIGLALQGSLSNVAGGVLILIMKPFRVGDYIVFGSTEGTVTEIGLIYTKIITVDRRGIVIPNGSLANGTVVNVSEYPTRRVDIKIGIAYESDIVKAKEVLRSVINQYEHLLPEEVTIFVNDLADSSVVLETRCFVKSEYYWDALWYLKEEYKKALDQSGISIPFPQIDVHQK